ncbi:hypothetical protein L195_g040561 [Trifolium pratense]|uniref:Transmembrane protein n=1 Tax=Trifolium pratense TaxID=57577 RepID=A0A2K3M147_TRIPR|nr:hypothetical protein L195_g040561 [Trifolium pratense]
MSYMDLRPSTFIINCFLLFLIVTFSRGGSETLDSEIYEIDYKGPETHSFVPPPDHSHGNPHSPHHKTPAAATKVMGLVDIDVTMKQKASF